MTRSERKKLMRVVALLHGDYGWDEAIKTLYGMIGPMTEAESEKMNKLTDSVTEKESTSHLHR